MHLRVFAQGPELDGRRITASRQSIPKVLIDSDEHRRWQVYHAKSRLCLRWLPRADCSRLGAAVLELARVRVQLGRRGASVSLGTDLAACPAAIDTFPSRRPLLSR